MLVDFAAAAAAGRVPALPDGTAALLHKLTDYWVRTDTEGLAIKAAIQVRPVNVRALCGTSLTDVRLVRVVRRYRQRLEAQHTGLPWIEPFARTAVLTDRFLTKRALDVCVAAHPGRAEVITHGRGVALANDTHGCSRLSVPSLCQGSLAFLRLWSWPRVCPPRTPRRRWHRFDDLCVRELPYVKASALFMPLTATGSVMCYATNASDQGAAGVRRGKIAPHAGLGPPRRCRNRARGA